MNEPTVAAVMTYDPAAVAPHTPFKDILDLLTDRAINAVPVVSASGRVLGVVSEVDLLRNRAHPGRHARGRLTAIELMTSPVVTVTRDTPLAEAMRKLVDTGYRQLFVLDRERLIGAVSRTDVLGVYRRPDKEIQAEIEHEILDGAASVRVSVDHGVVLLTGHRTADLDSVVARIHQIPNVIDLKERTQ